MSAVPTVYTEETLAKFMARTLGSRVVGALGWVSETAITAGNLGQWHEPVAEVLIALDVDDLSAWTSRDDIAALRNVARWRAWFAAREALGEAYDYSSGVASRSRNQLFENAKYNEHVAWQIARQHLENYDLRFDVIPEVSFDGARDEFGAPDE